MAAAIILLVASPIILLVIVSLAFTNRGNIWFVQTRPGYRGKLFSIIKFRTMADRWDAHGKLLPDELRLTAVGKIVRKFSLDELPQLANVLLGEMSLIGPRPLLAEYLPLYSEEQKKRHEVKPGITGWAQVNGRNTLTWKQKFNYDSWYVDHVTFLLDLKIIFLTMIKVFRAEGINSSQRETMQKFRGNI